MAAGRDRAGETASHTALLLKEQFTELLRTDEVKQRPLRFQQAMRDSEAAASDLEAAFSGSAESEHADAGHANLAFLRLTKQCADCHMEYRNVPLRDKERRPK